MKIKSITWDKSRVFTLDVISHVLLKPHSKHKQIYQVSSSDGKCDTSGSIYLPNLRCHVQIFQNMSVDVFAQWMNEWILASLISFALCFHTSHWLERETRVKAFCILIHHKLETNENALLTWLCSKVLCYRKKHHSQRDLRTSFPLHISCHMSQAFSHASQTFVGRFFARVVLQHSKQHERWWKCANYVTMTSIK